MVLIKYIEKKWFKTRLVYCLSGKVSSCSETVPDGYNFDVAVINNKECLKFVFKIVSSLQKDDCALTNVVINNSSRTLWHDNYPLKSGEGLIFASFVDPAFRGRNLYAFLLNFINDYFSQKLSFRVENLIAVVEESNVASKRSHEKCGYVVRERNFLVKFLGRNLFSVYSKPLRGYFVYKMRNSF